MQRSAEVVNSGTQQVRCLLQLAKFRCGSGLRTSRTFQHRRVVDYFILAQIVFMTVQNSLIALFSNTKLLLILLFRHLDEQLKCFTNTQRQHLRFKLWYATAVRAEVGASLAIPLSSYHTRSAFCFLRRLDPRNTTTEIRRSAQIFRCTRPHRSTIVSLIVTNRKE